MISGGETLPHPQPLIVMYRLPFFRNGRSTPINEEMSPIRTPPRRGITTPSPIKTRDYAYSPARPPRPTPLFDSDESPTQDILRTHSRVSPYWSWLMIRARPSPSHPYLQPTADSDLPAPPSWSRLHLSDLPLSTRLRQNVTARRVRNGQLL